jgi:hypothetical protein
MVASNGRSSYRWILSFFLAALAATIGLAYAVY